MLCACGAQGSPSITCVLICLHPLCAHNGHEATCSCAPVVFPKMRPRHCVDCCAGPWWSHRSAGRQSHAGGQGGPGVFDRLAEAVAQHVSPNTPELCDTHTGRTIFDIALRELPLQKSRCCMPRLSGSELSTVRVRFPLLRVALAHLHLRTHEHECEIMSSEVFLCMLVLLRVFGVPALAGELGCNHWCLTASPRT